MLTSTTMMSTYGAAAESYNKETQPASESNSASFRSQSKLREILRDQSRREEQLHHHQPYPLADTSVNSSPGIPAAESNAIPFGASSSRQAERQRRPSLVASVSAAVGGSDIKARPRRETLLTSSKTSAQLETAAMIPFNNAPAASLYPTTDQADSPSHGAASIAQHQRSIRQRQDRTREADTPSGTGTELVIDAGSSRLARSRSTATNLGGGIDLKVVILGSQGVGKTSLVHRYTSGQFSASAVPSTIGASFLTKKLIVDGVKVRLQLWDTAGQERFRSMAPMYYRGANAAVIVYDITNPHSFEDVRTWIDELRQNVQSDLVIHIVGSKVDLATYHRRVRLDDAQRTISEWTYAGHGEEASPASKAPPSASNMLFGTRRAPSTSPSFFASAATQTPSSTPSSPPVALAASGSRIPGLGSLAALGSKGTRAFDRTDAHGGDGASDPSSDSSSGAKANAATTAQDWDFIQVSEVSAKDNEGIEDVFVGIATRLLERKEELEARALAKKRQERESVYLGDGSAPAGYPFADPHAPAGWCCST